MLVFAAVHSPVPVLRRPRGFGAGAALTLRPARLVRAPRPQQRSAGRLRAGGGAARCRGRVPPRGRGDVTGPAAPAGSPGRGGHGGAAVRAGGRCGRRAAGAAGPAGPRRGAQPRARRLRPTPGRPLRLRPRAAAVAGGLRGAGLLLRARRPRPALVLLPARVPQLPGGEPDGHRHRLHRPAPPRRRQLPAGGRGHPPAGRGAGDPHPPALLGAVRPPPRPRRPGPAPPTGPLCPRSCGTRPGSATRCPWPRRG